MLAPLLAAAAAQGLYGANAAPVAGAKLTLTALVDYDRLYRTDLR